MQQPSNPGFGADQAPVDTHHDVLSAKPANKQKGLLEHLQSVLPNPLDILLAEDAASGVMVDNIVLQPVQPVLEPEKTPVSSSLGEKCRLSESMIWQMMRDYYATQGMNAWHSNVPNFITSSTYIAEAYAEMVLAFLEGYYDHLDVNEPLYIVELATGSGRFSHLFLRELERKLACFSRFQALKIRYVMTDFADSNVSFWMNHDKLRPFVESGRLDFGVYNSVVSNRIDLINSQECLAPDTLKNPLIAIANYFFDSIPMDVFRVESKVLKEGLVSLERNMEGVEPDSPPHISQIKTEFHYQDLYSANYYPEAKLNAILNHYRHTIKDGTILFPMTAFDAIRNLQAMSNNRLVLLSSDKSYTSVQEMIRYDKHEFAVHDGAFSYMVNYDAIGRYFTNDGGRFFYTEGKSLNIQTVCCIEMEQPDCDFERLHYLFKEKFNRTNTMNSLCNTLPDMEPQDAVNKMYYLLGQIRLHQEEPQVLSILGQQAADIVQNCLGSQQEDLLALMQNTLNNYYYYPGESNLPFWLSQLYYSMMKYSEALACLDLTIRYFGEHEALFYLKGLNYEKLERWQEAKVYYEKAIARNPDTQEAHEALVALKKRLK